MHGRARQSFKRFSHKTDLLEIFIGSFKTSVLVFWTLFLEQTRQWSVFLYIKRNYSLHLTRSLVLLRPGFEPESFNYKPEPFDQFATDCYRKKKKHYLWCSGFFFQSKWKYFNSKILRLERWKIMKKRHGLMSHVEDDNCVQAGPLTSQRNWTYRLSTSTPWGWGVKGIVVTLPVCWAFVCSHCLLPISV